MIRRLAHVYRRQRKALVIIAGLYVVAAITEAAALVLIAPLIQAAAEGRVRYEGSLGPVELDVPLSTLAWFSGVMFVIALLVQALTLYASARLMTGFRLRAGLEIVNGYQQADWSSQAGERDGWLITLSSQNVDQAAAGLNAIANWMKGFTGVTVFLVSALIVNWLATVLIIAVLSLLVLALRPVNKYGRRLGQEVAALNVEMNQELAVLTSNARELAVYDVVDTVGERYKQAARERRGITQRAQFTIGITAPVFRTCAARLIVFMIAVSAVRGDSEVAAVGVVAVLLYRSSNYGSVLVDVQQRLSQMSPLVEQLQEGIDRLHGSQRPIGHVELSEPTRITATDISYRYPNETSQALRAVTLTLDRGEVVGLVGPSGSGKSTLAEILVGLRRPEHGEVNYDDVGVDDLTARSRAASISLVSQQSPVLPDTIRENIRFHRHVSEDEVLMAAREAGLDTFLDSLPEGLDTVVGPGTRALSGGQAQRIGIARALAARPSFVVLDEPTSALDAHNEELVTETIGRLRSDVGVLVIAHRLSTLRHCDRVAVVEAGELTDTGPMSEVARRNDFVAHALEVGRLE